MLMTIISVLLASCGPAKAKEAVNLNDYTLEEIIKKHRKKGTLNPLVCRILG